MSCEGWSSNGGTTEKKSLLYFQSSTKNSVTEYTRLWPKEFPVDNNVYNVIP